MTCEDCIHYFVCHRIINGIPITWADKCGEFMAEQEPCDDAISRQAVLDVVEREPYKGDALSEIEQLPSVRPQEQTGHWIMSRDSYGNHHFTCSECGNDIATQYADNWEDKYCSECGAKMESEINNG